MQIGLPLLGMTGCFRWFVGIVMVLALAGVAACGKPAQPGGLPPAPTPGSAAPPSATASASPGPLTPPAPVTAGTPEQQILAQYKTFITVALPRAYAASSSARKAILSPVTMEPALSTYLISIGKLDSQHQEHRGAAAPLSQTVQRSGGTALVDACANTLQSGTYDKKSGDQLTSGKARDNLLFTLKLDPAGIWKISGTSYRDKPC